MIVSYGDKRTREFAEGRRVKALSGFDRQAQMRLDRLEAAASLQDLAALPGNCLEALKHDRKGRYSTASTTNGGYALNGRADHPARSMLRSQIYH